MKRIIRSWKNANQRLKQWREDLNNQKAEMEEENPTPQQDRGSSDEQTLTVEISLLSVFKASLVIMGVIILSRVAVQLIDIAVTFLIALFLSAAFDPAVNKLEKRGVPRGVGIIIIFILVFGFFIYLLGSLVPTIADQLNQIAQAMEKWVTNALAGSDENAGFFQQRISLLVSTILEQVNSEEIIRTINANIESIATNLSTFAGKGLNFISSTVTAIFNFILIMLLTFFLVLDKSNLNDFFHSLFPARHQQYLTDKMQLVQTKIGEWVHGQILLFFIVGTITYISFKIIGINYALTLAMVFGIAEFVPYVGPAVSFLVSAPIAFNDSFGTGIALVIFYVALQFVEGNIIVPWVMKRAVGLPPVVTIIALIIGASFPKIINPVLGMIFAVPVATIVAIFVTDFTSRNTNRDSRKIHLWRRKKKT